MGGQDLIARSLMDKVEEILQRSAQSGLFRAKLASMLRMCSVEEKPFQAIYAQQPNGLYRLVECKRVELGRGGSAAAGREEQISVEPGYGSETCPWCGCGPRRGERAGSKVLNVVCSACGWAVCLGKTEGILFRCACGSEGLLGDPIPLMGSVMNRVSPVEVGGVGGRPINTDARVPVRLQLSSGKK
jgi:hypothetical protein